MVRPMYGRNDWRLTMAPRPFRHRWIGQLLPIGSAAAVVLGIVLAPRMLGISDPARALVYGLGIGLVSSLILFVALRIWDRRLN